MRRVRAPRDARALSDSRNLSANARLSVLLLSRYARIRRKSSSERSVAAARDAQASADAAAKRASSDEWPGGRPRADSRGAATVAAELAARGARAVVAAARDAWPECAVVVLALLPRAGAPRAEAEPRAAAGARATSALGPAISATNALLARACAGELSGRVELVDAAAAFAPPPRPGARAELVDAAAAAALEPRADLVPDGEGLNARGYDALARALAPRVRALLDR